MAYRLRRYSRYTRGRRTFRRRRTGKYRKRRYTRSRRFGGFRRRYRRFGRRYGMRRGGYRRRRYMRYNPYLAGKWYRQDYAHKVKFNGQQYLEKKREQRAQRLLNKLTYWQNRLQFIEANRWLRPDVRRELWKSTLGVNRANNAIQRWSTDQLPATTGNVIAGTGAVSNPIIPPAPSGGTVQPPTDIAPFYGGTVPAGPSTRIISDALVATVGRPTAAQFVQDEIDLRRRIRQHKIDLRDVDPPATTEGGPLVVATSHWTPVRDPTGADTGKRIGLYKSPIESAVQQIMDEVNDVSDL